LVGVVAGMGGRFFVATGEKIMSRRNELLIKLFGSLQTIETPSYKSENYHLMDEIN